MRRLLSMGAVAALLLVPMPGLAGPFSDAEARMRLAYGQYRIALFASNTGDVAGTEAALTGLTQSWTELGSQWQAAAPPQYVDDPELPTTLNRVSAILDEARVALAAGDLPRTHETLEGVRAELAALHLRNGVETFSDRMNAYHAQMETVLAGGYDAEGGPERLREDAAVLVYLARQIAAHPAPEAADPRYAPMVAAFAASAEALQAAARAGDPVAAAAAMGALKQPYAKFFLFFG